MNKIISLIIILLCSTTYGQKVKDLSSEKFTKTDHMILFKNKPFNGIGVTYQGENQPKTKIQYENGLINGISEVYFNNYRLKAKGELVQENRNNAKSKKNGLWVFYDKDGSLLGECNYNSNVPVSGFAVEYHENENIKSIVEYLNGKKNGAMKLFHNGVLSSEYHYIDDIEKGIFKEYTTDGTIAWRIGDRLDGSNYSFQEFDTTTGILWHYLEFKDGKEVAEKQYYSNGQILYESYALQDGGRRGIRYFESGGVQRKYTDNEQFEYYESGQLKLSKKENIEIRYSEDGKMKEKGQILSYQKNGVWESYSSSGEITRREYFIKDTLNNSVPFENGAPINENYDGYVFDLNWNNYKDLQKQFEKKSNGLYFLNQPLTARLTVRFNNGLISRIENYVNGKEEGVFESYNEEGIPYHKKSYKNGLLHGLEELYFWDRPILDERRNWEYGELNGICEMFHRNGQLMRKDLYEVGKLVDNIERKSIEEVYWGDDAESLSIKHGIYYKNESPYSGLIKTRDFEGYSTEQGYFLDGHLVGYFRAKDPKNIPDMQDLYEVGQVYMNNNHRNADLKNRGTSNENYDSRSNNSQSNHSDCRVDISSESNIQRYLERGLRTSDAGGSVLTYKTIYDWNTVGVEIKFDNGNKVSGINVRITPGNYRAKVFMDFPEIGNSGVYYLTSDGVLKSEDGTFTYLCQ
jgi:uncharacterized protein